MVIWTFGFPLRVEGCCNGVVICWLWGYFLIGYCRAHQFEACKDGMMNSCSLVIGCSLSGH
jgi:hypothetical protein